MYIDSGDKICLAKLSIYGYSYIYLCRILILYSQIWNAYFIVYFYFQIWIYVTRDSQTWLKSQFHQ